MFKKRLYMDFASSAPLHPRVARAMRRALSVYGNPSAPHEEGREAKKLLEDARQRIARILSVKSESLIFTGSGTESNNLAIHGVVEALLKRGALYADMHIITAVFEHPSVLEPIRALEARGVAVTYLAPTSEGFITPAAVSAAIRPETVLVSVAAAQGELGVLQDIRGISRVLEAFKKARAQKAEAFAPEAAFPILHTDASQSLFADFSPEKLQADMATYDAQKLMGPKGAGLLYKHSSVPLAPFVRGGSQERRARPGTENVLAAVGMAEAFEVAHEKRAGRAVRVRTVRDYLAALLAKEIPQAHINGSMEARLPNNLNISIPGVDGDYLAVLLDKEGIAVSPRSACIASGEVSPAVAALGADDASARGTIRFSFGPSVTMADARRAALTLKKALSHSKI